MQRRITTLFIPLSLLLSLYGAVCPSALRANGLWTITDSLNVARSGHTATLLPNGQVLVVGGYGYPGVDPTNSAELYDPATGMWTLTGSTSHARVRHTATLLPNGRVLVVGAAGGSQHAELYDPAAGQWSLTGSLLVGRSVHTATLLPNGKVLVAGGSDGNDYLDSTELYDPLTQVWTPTGNLNGKRGSHTATLLPDGQVLVVGRWVNSDLANSAELYDPATGVWAPTGSLIYDRLHSTHTATLLQDGKVLVAGGHIYGYGNAVLDSVEAYQPASGEWYAVGPLNIGRQYHTATLLPNGKVLVAGGIRYTSAADSASFLVPITEVYNPATLVWTAGSHSDILQMLLAGLGHTMTVLPNGQVLVAWRNRAELFDSASTCTAIAISPATLWPGTYGAAYAQTFSETGSSGTTVWSISAGTLPSGMSLDAASGVLSGTPTAVGTFPITVRATNGNCLGKRSYTLVVKAVSTMSVAVSANPVAAGQALTVTAWVSTPDGGTPTGTVQFSVISVNSWPVGSIVTPVGGRASLDITAPAATDHIVHPVIRVAYSGDATYYPSTRSLTLTVFDFAVQDDTTDDYLLFNTDGAYLFRHCAEKEFLTGEGTFEASRCTLSLNHITADREVAASVNACAYTATATATVVYQGVTFTLTDSDTTTNTHTCQ